MQSGPSSRAWKIFLWGSSLPALLAASFLYFPYAFTGPVLCPTSLTLGLPCPGCGMSRALGLATHGRPTEAFSYHALWPLVLGYFTFLWVYKLTETARGEAPKLPTYRIGAVAIFVLMGFWVLRLVLFFAHGGLQVMAHDNLFSRLARLF